MYFLVDNNKKIIFGWTPKCGCSYIKYMYWFLQTDNLNNEIHTSRDSNSLPDDIQNYTTIIISRNPYKRLLSGFLDKYSKDGDFRYLWKDSTLSFCNFVNKLINYEWEVIDKHHFSPQTSENFDEKILLSKIIKFYDISNIDYEFIEKLYNKQIPDCVRNKKIGHERANRVLKKEYFNNYVFNLNIDFFIDYNIDIKYFYNEEIRKKVFNFFIKDFIFFKQNGIDYYGLEN